MKIDFYHWDCQCPISHETILLLNEYRQDFEIHCHDISNDPQTAEEKKIYFPFLTVFNNCIRWRSPLNKNIIEKVKNNEAMEETPYIIPLGKERFIGEITELNNTNIHLVSNGCTMRRCAESCEKKAQFMSGKCGEFYGCLNLKDGQVVGGAEYVPSMQVPYDIPRDENTAFLTCLYHSSTEYDYKAYPLEVLERKLAAHYKRIIAVSGERGVFPNGDLQWFTDHGYTDNGVIGIEENYCILHLVSKDL